METVNNNIEKQPGILEQINSRIIDQNDRLSSFNARIDHKWSEIHGSDPNEKGTEEAVEPGTVIGKIDQSVTTLARLLDNLEKKVSLFEDLWESYSPKRTSKTWF